MFTVMISMKVEQVFVRKIEEGTSPCQAFIDCIML